MTGEYYTLHLDEQGNRLYQVEQEAIIRSLLDKDKLVTDLWIFSHGWNTNEERADTTYGNWVRLIQERIQQEITDPGFRPLYVGIYWPSIAWVDNIKRLPISPPPSPLASITSPIDQGEFEMDIEGPAQSSEADESEDEQLEIGRAVVPDRLFANELIDKAHFVEVYRTLIDPRGQYLKDYEQDFALLYDILVASSPSSSQLETFMKILYRYKFDDPHNEVVEDSNILNSPESARVYLQAQLDISTTYEGFQPDNILFQFFHTFTFWMMKARAAIVGQHGVTAFLRDVKHALLHNHYHIRVHLLGHSFGAKLISAAVYELANAPNLKPPLVDSLILLLGAFSQFSFSSKIPFKSGGSGRYASIIEQGLVASPIVAIYSCHDLANKRCYPFGMFMGPTSPRYERGGTNDRLGSIGANGAQGLEPRSYRVMNLLPVEMLYDRKHLTDVSCLNIDGQHIINTYADHLFVGAHGDIYRPEIFHLALAVSRHE